MAVHITRESARTANEVIEAVGRWWWYEYHDSNELPADYIPAMGTLATWIPKCPDAASAEGAKQLSAVVVPDPKTAYRLTVDEEFAPMHVLDWPPTCTWFVSSELKLMAHVTWSGGGPASVRVQWHIEAALWVTEVNAAWLGLPDPRPLHPLSAIIGAWLVWREAQGDPPGRVHVLMTQEKRPPKNAEPLRLARMPGLLALMQTPLEAVAVGGKPLVTATPDTRPRKLYRVVAPKQGELWAAPRRLDGHATGGALVETVAATPLVGDERSPLRADLIRVGTLAYALTRTMRLTPGELSILVTGADTPAGRLQGWKLVWLMRVLSVKIGAVTWLAFIADPGDPHVIGPPRWWLDYTGPRSSHLTGALLRRISGEGRKAARWGTSERTIGGIEGALLWGPSAGKGRDGRLPDALRPVRQGGPGADVVIPWHHVLRLAGDHITPAMLADKEKSNTLTQRYLRRVNALKDAGYFVQPDGGAAPAGDTIEIVRQIRGGRGREAAIVVRATARFCAAYGKGGERIRVPASHLLLL